MRGMAVSMNGWMRLTTAPWIWSCLLTCWFLPCEGAPPSHLSAGGAHTLVISEDGYYWAWGDNRHGQLGTGGAGGLANVPVRNNTISGWRLLSGGDDFTLGIREDGSLWSWGYNFYGQLGDGTSDKFRPQPKQVGESFDWFSVSSGPYHCAALKMNGSLWTWGINGGGQLGHGTIGERYQTNKPTRVGTGVDWAAAAAGWAFTIGLKKDGTLWAWGVVGPGGDAGRSGSPVQVGPDKDWAAIAAGKTHVLALKRDGTLWSWGSNQYGQLGRPAGAEDWVPGIVAAESRWDIIAAGYNHSAAIKRDATLWSWGFNRYGQLGLGFNGDPEYFESIFDQEPPPDLSANRSLPVQVGAEAQWKNLDAGSDHTVAAQSDGTIWSWGKNWNGQVGNGEDGDPIDFSVIQNSPTNVFRTTADVQPVIFIPGMAASDLKEVEGLIHFPLWPTVQPAKIKTLTLNPAERQLQIIATDATRHYRLFEKYPDRYIQGEVYGPLLRALVQAGYPEYQVNQDPSRRTPAGMDMGQLGNQPKLFVFAYDWRHSNAEASKQLRAYIEVVQKFYPGTKVDLIAHSMGGLVARRYILDYPDHHVDKLITVGSPFLGAPVATYRMEKGEFFGKFVDFWTSRSIADVVEFFPGMHELLASGWYYQLRGSFYADVTIGDYSYDDFVRFMDRRWRRSITGFGPGTNNRRFHEGGQDDWRNDQSGIKYLHVVGHRATADTVGKVVRFIRPVLAGPILLYVPHFRQEFTVGDKTVPLYSATKTTGSIDLNAPGAVVRVYDALTGGHTSDQVEHTGLTTNPVVQADIINFLKTGVTTPLPLPRAPFSPMSLTGDPKIRPSFYLTLLGAAYCVVSYPGGASSFKLNESFTQPLPGVSVYSAAPNGYEIVVPDDASCEITFETTLNPVLLDATWGPDNLRPARINRHAEHLRKPGTIGRIRLGSGGQVELAYDIDRDGSFESPVPPDRQITGSMASDLEPPVVTVEQEAAGNLWTLAINAADAGSGVQRTYYALDAGPAQQYSGPLSVDPAQTSFVHAFAEDRTGNRSGIVTQAIGNSGVPGVVEIVPQDPYARAGEAVCFDVFLRENVQSLRSLSLRLAFDTNLMSLINGSTEVEGSIVPPASNVEWDLSDANNAYRQVANKPTLSVLSTETWPQKEGLLARVCFAVHSGAGRSSWPVQVHSVRVAGEQGRPGFVRGSQGWVLGAEIAALRPRLVSLVSSNSAHLLLAYGEIGDRYAVEASHDLRTWSPVGTLTNQVGVMLFQGDAFSEAGARFYRLSYSPGE